MKKATLFIALAYMFTSAESFATCPGTPPAGPGQVIDPLACVNVYFDNPAISAQTRADVELYVTAVKNARSTLPNGQPNPNYNHLTQKALVEALSKPTHHFVGSSGVQYSLWDDGPDASFAYCGWAGPVGAFVPSVCPNPASYTTEQRGQFYTQFQKRMREENLLVIEAYFANAANRHDIMVVKDNEGGFFIVTPRYGNENIGANVIAVDITAAPPFYASLTANYQVANIFNMVRTAQVVKREWLPGQSPANISAVGCSHIHFDSCESYQTAFQLVASVDPHKKRYFTTQQFKDQLYMQMCATGFINNPIDCPVLPAPLQPLAVLPANFNNWVIAATPGTTVTPLDARTNMITKLGYQPYGTEQVPMADMIVIHKLGGTGGLAAGTANGNGRNIMFVYLSEEGDPNTPGWVIQIAAQYNVNSADVYVLGASSFWSAIQASLPNAKKFQHSYNSLQHPQNSVLALTANVGSYVPKDHNNPANSSWMDSYFMSIVSIHPTPQN